MTQARLIATTVWLAFWSCSIFAQADFIKFYDDPYTLFEKDLKNVYGKK